MRDAKVGIDERRAEVHVEDAFGGRVGGDGDCRAASRVALREGTVHHHRVFRGGDEIVGGFHRVPRARLDDIVGRHRVLHGDDDEPGGNRTVVDLDGVRGYAARAKPAENLAAELVVAHAGDDGRGAAELVQMARHVRGGAAEEKTRGEGILRWGRERSAGERDGEGVSRGETEEYAVSDDYVENRGDARRAEVGSRERGDEETRGGRGISSGCRAARCRAHPEGLSDDGDALAARADENGASVATTGRAALFERRRDAWPNVAWRGTGARAVVAAAGFAKDIVVADIVRGRAV